jgi:hypothetical protein
MRQLPKFVLERLNISRPLAGHPDADLLTAFAERSLSASERDLVLEHIARCGDCREIITLALPATEAAQAITYARSPWRWPVLRGAAAVAGIVVVAALGIYEFQHRRSASVTVARNVETKQIVTPSIKTESKTAASSPPVTALQGIVNREQPATPAQSAQPSAQPSPSVVGALGLAGKSTDVAAGSGGGIGSGINTTQRTKIAMAEPPRDLALANSAPPPTATKQLPAPSRVPNGNPPPASSEMVEVQSQDAVAGQALENGDAVPAPVESADNLTRAKPAATPPSAPSGANLSIASRNVLDAPPNQGAPTPHWTISSTGSLQRSVDSGKTWQDVNVNARPGLYASSMQMAVVSKDQESKKVGRKTVSANAAPMTPPAPVFRALAVIGNQVWAAASGGLLYHSADGGTLWTSIVPSAQGVTLTGDIIRIEFSDTLHGTFSTSTSETWTTADGGQSWQKQ